jgi:type IV pilus assembly protein PilC
VAGFVFFKFYAKRPNIKAKIDRLKLKLPIIGPLNEATLMTDISRTLAMLISTGVPLIDGVQIIGRSTGNILFEKAFKRVSERVEKGFSLSDAMREQIVFPDILVEMVATGEQTGKLDKTLGNISHYFEVEAEQRVKTLTSAIEPLIMIVLGVGVGFLVFAVIMPIYSLTSQF